MAQWILESGRGTSKLSRELLNFGGLKYRPELSSVATPVLIKVPSESRKVKFCKFNSVADFIKGYWLFIGRSPYKGYKNTSTSLSYINHIAKAGYATDPSYIKKVRSRFNEAKQLLDVKSETESPTNTSHIYTKPVFKILPSNIKFDRQGSYKTPTGQAKGLVVHYTVSDRSERSAQGVARYMASKGLGCAVMDYKGQIWIPKNWDIKSRWDDHCGRSEWKGRTSLSRLLIGMEICNWGRGANNGKASKPWRRISRKIDHRDIGVYQAYTKAQEKALINFCLWAKDNIKGFSFDWVVGHDEIAPRRKSDPSGSLSMSMPEFRKLLNSLYNDKK